MPNLIFSRGVLERDIQLLLVEEFYSSESFRKQFIENIEQPEFENLNFVAVEHSVVFHNGETDLIVKFENNKGEKHWLIIEVKIKAELHNDQEARTVERAKKYEQNNCAVACPVLVAPKDYVEKVPIRLEGGFKARVSYQNIISWIENSEEKGEQRKDFKKKLLKEAISRKGYVKYRIIAVVNFYEQYRKMAEFEYPKLNFITRVPSGTHNFWNYHPSFLTIKESTYKIELVHKLYVSDRKGGFVDLKFLSTVGKFDEFDSFFKKLKKDERMFIDKRHDSVVISIKVPNIYVEQDFETQKEAVRESMEAVEKMALWFKRNRDKWTDFLKNL